MIKDIYEILVPATVSVINHAPLVNIWIIKIVCEKNSLVDKLVEECANAIDGNKIYSETLNTTIASDDCASCTLYVVLFAVFLTAKVMIGGFVYFYWYRKKDIVRKYLKKNVNIKLNPFKKNRLLKPI